MYRFSLFMCEMRMVVVVVVAATLGREENVVVT